MWSDLSCEDWAWPLPWVKGSTPQGYARSGLCQQGRTINIFLLLFVQEKCLWMWLHRPSSSELCTHNALELGEKNLRPGQEHSVPFSLASSSWSVTSAGMWPSRVKLIQIREHVGWHSLVCWSCLHMTGTPVSFGFFHEYRFPEVHSGDTAKKIALLWCLLS